MLKYPILAISLALPVLCCLPVSGAQDPSRGIEKAKTEIRRIKLPEPPTWTVSGAFRYDDTQIVFADSADDVLRPYSLKNGRAIAHTGGDPNSTVGRIQQTADGFILQDRTNVFKNLASDLTLKAEYKLADVKGVEGYSIGSINSWSCEHESNGIYAFGYLYKSKTEWIAGLMYIPLTSPGEFVLTRKMDNDDQDLMIYLLGLQMTAVNPTNGEGYFISIESGVPAFTVLDRGVEVASEPLHEVSGAFPAHLSMTLDNKTSAMTQFQMIEMSAAPVGVYSSFSGKPFVLFREPKEGKTEWSLIGIDPTGRNLSASEKIILPTTANHLAVSVGEKYWGFLEKGRVEDFAVQSVESLLLVSSSLIDSEKAWMEQVVLPEILTE